MAVEVDAEQLAKSQAEAISGFFGMEIPKPGDWSFKALEKNRQEGLFNVNALCPFYIPRRQLAEGVAFPGLKRPLDPWFYDQIRAGIVAADADWLSEGWILVDVTKRPAYNGGRQMYSDTPRFREMLATLREQGQIAVPDLYSRVSKDSRFAISPDEIDGNEAVVSKAVANILGITAQQVGTLSYSTFGYIGNLAHPEFGQVNTSEWLRNRFERGRRLDGGGSDFGGLSGVRYWVSGARGGSVGFRLQLSSPAKSRSLREIFSRRIFWINT